MKKFNSVNTIIFGAGPAGLAGAHKLVKNNKSVIIFEKEKQVGGISKTVNFKGYRFDLGGHRFFTKNKEVNQLWQETLGRDFLVRPRLSRIFYKNKFFDYPVKPLNALRGLGFFESMLIGFDFLKTQIFPSKEEKNFEQWVSNRFGKRLFNHFFKSYTEKVWGIPCEEIQAEWAAQRIKGLSLLSTLKNAILPDKKGKIKTLVEEFRYPKFGPGMMYEKMAENISKMGGKVSKEQEIIEIVCEKNVIEKVVVKNREGQKEEYQAEYFLSSMPITKLVQIISPAPPKKVLEASINLNYRSFLTVSVILNTKKSFPDTWIYVHSPEVKMGRIQNFKNWSPFMVPDQNKTTLGLEYFCSEGDELWKMEDKELLKLGMRELEKIGLGQKNDFVSGFVARVPKAYPVYDQNYPKNIEIIKEYLAGIKNLQPIGRYGMFKYNNMDHSILTGLYAAENILGKTHNIWEVNADEDYQEEK